MHPLSMLVEKSDCQQLRQELHAIFAGLIDIENGQPLIDVGYPEEVYAGPFVDQAPDLILTSRAQATGTIVMNELTDVALRHQFEIADRISASHLSGEPGIFFACGPGIAGGREIDIALVDIVPSLCTRFGVPYPNDVDGSARSLLTKGCAAPQTAELLPSAITAGVRDEDAVLQQLQALGYIG